MILSALFGGVFPSIPCFADTAFIHSQLHLDNSGPIHSVALTTAIVVLHLKSSGHFCRRQKPWKFLCRTISPQLVVFNFSSHHTTQPLDNHVLKVSSTCLGFLLPA